MWPKMPIFPFFVFLTTLNQVEVWNGRVAAVNQEKAELGRRESIEKFNKAQLKKTNTIEKNSLPDTQGMKCMD